MQHQVGDWIVGESSAAGIIAHAAKASTYP